MKKIVLFVLVLLSSFLNGQSQKKVLFIGNSMTYFNDMPLLFESIANEKGKNVDVDFYAPGGTGFVNHHVDNNVYSLFQNNVWDMVILQPGTSESAGVSWPVNTTAARGNQMQDSIKKYSPCAKIFLYQIPYGVPSSDTYATYFQVQTKIKDSISKLADSMHVPFVAAGECARQHYLAQQDLLLHNSYNDVHPNLNGSYLVACAMYAAIFQEPVSNTVFNGGVTPVNASYFQNIADNIILNNKPSWRINTYNLHSEFSLIQTDNSVSFTNLSANYNSILWDFGDGITSTEINPQHNYSSTGTKTIQLTVFRNGCSEIFEKQVQINVLKVPEFNNDQFVSVYPTCFQEMFFIKSDKDLNGIIFNSLAQKIYDCKISSGVNTIDLSNYSSGIYYLNLNNQIYKLVKN